MKEIFRKCVEFILITLLMWAAGAVFVFAALCLMLFSPVIALWSITDESYESTDERLDERELNE